MSRQEEAWAAAEAAAQALAPEAGQFASVTFAGCAPRDYSMANVPGDRQEFVSVRDSQGHARGATHAC